MSHNRGVTVYFLSWSYRNRIFNFRYHFSGQVGNTVRKIQHKYERHLSFVEHILIKHSRNGYLFNFWVFSYICDDHSCINFCISIKIPLDCISNQYWYVKMPDVTANYGMPLNFITFFLRILHKIDEYSCLKYCISTKLSQIVYLINTHIWYVDMSDVTTSYGRFY